MFRRVASLTLSLMVVLAATPRAHAATTAVQVRSNFYDPKIITIQVGDTVAWTAFEDGHTVTADDGRFDFYADRLLRRGETVTFTATQNDETIYYHCRVHAPAMSGVIVVGKGTPKPPPPPPSNEVRTVPSAKYGTVEDALKGAAEGTTISVLPGTYRLPVTVTSSGVTIRGAGASSADVVFDGRGAPSNAFTVQAHRVTIEHLTIDDWALGGVVAEGVSGIHVRDVAVRRSGGAGIRMTAGATGGVLEDLSVGGSTLAGIVVEGCESCDAVVRRVTVTGSGAGFLGRNAGSLVVLDSTFSGNGAGVVLKTVLNRAGAPQRGAHIYGNTISDNTRWVAPPQPNVDLDWAVGAGVWVAGGIDDVVERNTITGHRYGIAVTGLGAPSVHVVVRENVVGGSAVADLGFDGLGAAVCFSGNGGASQATSEPPAVQTIYACGTGSPVGVPYPKVDADLLTYAQRGQPVP